MTEAYGNYILRTGKGLVGEHELLLGEHWYRTMFAGLRPIADVGPGRCWFTKQNPADIIAVDNSPELVEHFSGEGIDIRLGDACAMPFSDGFFQGVFCCWLLEHLADPARAFSEFHRVLRPGGLLCVVVPTPVDMVAFYDDYTHVRPFTARSLGQLSCDSGFSRYETECLPWTRGISRVQHHLGIRAAGRYLRFADVGLRKIGLTNRRNLILRAWK